MRIEERIGKRVREAREQASLTQEELGSRVARWLGPERKRWSKQTVSAAESGGRAFTAEDLFVLSFALGKPVYWFFGVGDYTAERDEQGRITTNLEDIMRETNQIRLPNGDLLTEDEIRSVVGTPPSDAPQLAGELRRLADRVESIRVDVSAASSIETAGEIMPRKDRAEP